MPNERETIRFTIDVEDKELAKAFGRFLELYPQGLTINVERIKKQKKRKSYGKLT